MRRTLHQQQALSREVRDNLTVLPGLDPGEDNMIQRSNRRR
jgi:hypothetical protein